MIEHRLGQRNPLSGTQLCNRCGWSTDEDPEPCRRPKVGPGFRVERLRVVRLSGVEEWGTYKKGRQKGQPKRGSKIWLCKCDCGRHTLVPTHRLTTAVTRSCGCLRRRGRKA